PQFTVGKPVANGRGAHFAPVIEGVLRYLQLGAELLHRKNVINRSLHGGAARLIRTHHPPTHAAAPARYWSLPHEHLASRTPEPPRQSRTGPTQQPSCPGVARSGRRTGQPPGRRQWRR